MRGWNPRFFVVIGYTLTQVSAKARKAVLASRPDYLHFRLSTLDDDPGIKPTFNAFVSSKAPWHEIADGLVQHERLPKRP